MRAERSRPRQRGAAALEFALVVPVLLLTIMGMIDFGMVMNAQAVVANAARDAARYATLDGSEANSRFAGWTSASSLLYVTPTVATSPLPTASNPQVTVECFKDLPATPANACPLISSRSGSDFDKGRLAKYIVRATVTYTYKYITPISSWIGLGPQVTITKVSYMRIEAPSQ